MDGEIVTHECGAKSTKLEEAWGDMPFAGLRAIARRFQIGRAKYGSGNWRNADAAFAAERLDHLVRHVILFAEYRRQEDLDALLCNGAMLAHYKEQGWLLEVSEKL